MTSCAASDATRRMRPKGIRLTLEKMTPGVQCGHCHEADGGSPCTQCRTTAASSRSARPDRSPSFPRNRRPTSAASATGPGRRSRCKANPSIANVRFQPYRLTESKCYDPDDARISCLACHDPHTGGKRAGRQITMQNVRLVTRAGRPAAKACPVSKSQLRHLSHAKDRAAGRALQVL